MRRTSKKPLNTGSEIIDHPRVHPALKQYLGYALYKAAIRIRAELAREMASYAIIPAQFGILRVLEESGPLNQMSLGDSMGIDKASMVKLIDGLETGKYIKRTTSTEDRRAKFVSLTEKGVRTLAKVLGHAKKVEENFLKPLTEVEKKSFRVILEKLISRP